MNDKTRREFLEWSAKASAGAMVFGLSCQDATITDDAANRIKFITNVDDGSWFYFSGLSQVGRPVPANAVPQINADDWALKIFTADKEVGNITFRLLKSLQDQGEDVTYLKTMRCILGPYVQNESGILAATGLFRGIPLSRVLDETSVSPETLKFEVFGQDGFTSALTANRVYDESLLPVMLAYELNGAPIPPRYGGPVRLVAPEMWAFKCIKWITRMNATTNVSTFGTFESELFGGRAFIDNPGNMGLMALMRDPSSIVADVPTSFTLNGVALVGSGLITNVEYSVDGGAFLPAEIVPLEEIVADIGHLGLLVRDAEQFGQSWPYQDVWVPWRIDLELGTGTHRISIRTSDDQRRTTLPSAVEQHQIAPALSLQLNVV